MLSTMRILVGRVAFLAAGSWERQTCFDEYNKVGAPFSTLLFLVIRDIHYFLDRNLDNLAVIGFNWAHKSIRNISRKILLLLLTFFAHFFVIFQGKHLLICIIFKKSAMRRWSLDEWAFCRYHIQAQWIN